MRRALIFLVFTSTIALASGQLIKRQRLTIPIDVATDLQNKLDSNTIISPGTYRFDKQLVLTNGWISPGVTLEYTGPPRTDGCIKVPAMAWYKDINRFWLQNIGTLKKGVGIATGNDSRFAPHGTESGVAIWSGVTVDGFEIGVQLGDLKGRATSELTLINLQTRNCDIGVKAEGSNTLDITLIQFLCSSCRVGLESTSAGHVHVLSGSASDIKESVFIFRPGGISSVANFRTETSGRLATIGNTTAITAINIENCSTNGMIRNDGIEIQANWGCSLSIKNCIFDGYVFYNPSTGQGIGHGTISMEQVYTYWPYLLKGTPGAPDTFDIRQCGLINKDANLSRRIQQRAGIISDGPIPK